MYERWRRRYCHRRFADPRCAKVSGTLVIARPTGGPSGTSFKCGHRAFLLAGRVASELLSLSAAAQGRGRIHIFIAAPNAVAFFLGQNQSVCVPKTSSEYDAVMEAPKLAG